MNSQPVGDLLPEYAATRVAVAGDDGGYEIVDAERAVGAGLVSARLSGP